MKCKYLDRYESSRHTLSASFNFAFAALSHHTAVPKYMMVPNFQFPKHQIIGEGRYTIGKCFFFILTPKKHLNVPLIVNITL